MFSLNCQLFIGPLPEITFVHEVEIVSSWQKLTDTATITLPRKVKVLGHGRLDEVVEVGDPVTIRYGYNGRYRTEFTGVVAAIKSGAPFCLECEDFMWYLKRKQMSYSWRKVSLTELLTYIQQQYAEFFPPRGFEFQVLGETDLGKHLINQATAAQVFDDLKKRIGISFFFREGVLMAGDPYHREGNAEVHKYDFRRNIIESDLTFVKARDLALHFRGTSTQANGNKIQFDYDPLADVVSLKNPAARHHKGDPAPTPTVAAASGNFKGELKTLLMPPNLSGPALAAAVRKAAARICFDGYRGEGLLGFGEPVANHGDVAELHDPDYPERAGRYRIDAVTKTFGVNGSRRKLKLGPRVPVSKG